MKNKISNNLYKANIRVSDIWELLNKNDS